MMIGTMDIVIGVMLCIGIIDGLLKGVLKQLALIAGLLVGVLVARALYDMVADKLAPVINVSVSVAQVLSFVLIWLFVPMVFLLVASIVTRALKAVHLDWINRLLGGVFGAVKFLVLAGLAIYVLEYIDPDSHVVTQEQKQQSILYKPAKESIDYLLPFVHSIKKETPLDLI